MKKKVVLFDIDNTLIRASKGHKKAFVEFLKDNFRISITEEKLKEYEGKIDNQILLEILKENKIKVKKKKIKTYHKALTHLAKKHISKEKFIVLKGAKEILRELQKKNVLLGVLTGNLKEIARAKLKKLGIYTYFKVGAFGGEAFDRADLVKIALDRISNIDISIKRKDIFIIGDSIYDVMCGKPYKIKTIAVATGEHSYGRLKSKGPNYLFKDLSDYKNIIKIILKD